jgi:hypothetical protein
MIAPFILELRPGHPFADLAIVSCGYSVLLAWACWILASNATWPELKAEVPIAFILTAFTTPALGRVFEHAFGKSADWPTLYCHAVTIAVIALPIWAGYRAKTRKTDEYTPACKVCGYCVRGLTASRCPECGTPIGTIQEMKVPDADST